MDPADVMRSAFADDDPEAVAFAVETFNLLRDDEVPAYI